MNKTKFKVGDKVIGKAGSPYGVTREGWIGEVVSVSGDSIRVQNKEKKQGPYSVLPEYFGLYEPAPAPKYKIGDIVRVRNDLIVDEQYYNDDGVTRDSFVDSMVEFKGCVFKIREYKVDVDDGGEKYLLETTDGEEIGWNWTDGMLEPVGTKAECNKKVVIETDGEITTAILYDGETIIKMATAKCMPDDEFDFECGLNIALDRLIEAEPRGLK